MQWVKDYEGDYKPSTFKDIKNYIEKLFIPNLGEMDIREIKIKDIKPWLKQGSVYTRKNTKAYLRKIFNDFRRDGWLESSLEWGNISIKEPEKFQGWIDEDAQWKIIDGIEEEHQLFFKFCVWHWGFRPGTVRALMHKDFYLNYENPFVVGRRAWSIGKLIENTKTDRDQVLPIHPEFLEIYKTLPKTHNFVFTYRGKPYDRFLPSKIWRRACKKVGVDIAFYPGTKHSGATQAIIRGEDRAGVGEILGHTSDKTTRRYAQYDIVARSKIMMKRYNIVDFPRVSEGKGVGKVSRMRKSTKNGIIKKLPK